MFDWIDFLHLAAELANPPEDEARQRTGMSRAYYAAYHVATRRIVGELRFVLGRPQHQLWGELRQQTRPDLREIGERGRDLHLIRVRADYHQPFNRDDSRLDSIPDAGEAIRLATELIALTQAL